MPAATLPLPMRVPLRLVERVSALGSGAAFATLIGYINSLDFTFGHNSSGPWTFGFLFVLSIACAFVLRSHATTMWSRRARHVLAFIPFPLAGYVSALEGSYQKPWSSAGDHVSTSDWLSLAMGGLVDLRFLLAGVAMFVVVALPLQLARTRAERGIAGQERGEAIVAIVSLATAFPVLAPRVLAAIEGVPAYANGFVTAVMGIAAVAALVNVVALVLAVLRSIGRARFLRRVTEGHEPSFRIDDTPQGRALVRVTKQGDGYRVADFTETLLELSEVDEPADPATPRHASSLRQ